MSYVECYKRRQDFKMSTDVRYILIHHFKNKENEARNEDQLNFKGKLRFHANDLVLYCLYCLCYLEII